MIQNPLVFYELAKMEHYETREKDRRYWEQVFEQRGSPCPPRSVNITRLMVGLVLAIPVVWAIIV